MGDEQDGTKGREGVGRDGKGKGDMGSGRGGRKVERLQGKGRQGSTWIFVEVRRVSSYTPLSLTVTSQSPATIPDKIAEASPMYTYTIVHARIEQGPDLQNILRFILRLS